MVCVFRRSGLITLVTFSSLLLLVQLVPYGHDHTNLASTGEPQWDSPRTRELAARACFDCHSGQTVWPWYSNVAPVSWLVQHDTEEARGKLDFTDWARSQQKSRDAAEQVRTGEMPLPIYLPLHPLAKLTASEKEELATGFEKTFGAGRGR